MHFFKKSLVLLAFIAFGASSRSQSFTVDQRIGAEGAVQIANTVGLYADSNIATYIDAIGQKLVGYLGKQPFTYHFNVLDMAEPNAFALPGGYVYVSRGILALANSEDEIAGVIAHEIMHVHKRHGIQQSKRSILPNIIQLPGAVVGSVINEELGQIINAPAALSSGLILSSYSRSHESEADLLGAELMSAAGYTPSALPRILHHLHQEVEAITGEEESFSYFDSHPFTPNRVENLEKRIETGKIVTPSSSKRFIGNSDFKNLLNGLPLDQNPKAGLLIDDYFVQPEIDFYITFPNHWKSQNSPMALVAIDSTAHAQIVVEAVSDTLTPAEYGRITKKKLWQSRGLKANQSQIVELDNQPGYLLKYEEQMQQGQDVVAYVFWWKTRSNTILRIAAIGVKELDSELWSTLQSIGSIPDSLEISYNALEIVTAKEGERISDVVEREKGNTLSMSMLAAINGVSFNYQFKEASLVKMGAMHRIAP